MRQFLQGSEEAWRDLERRAQGACLVFQVELPPGCAPPQGRVGFEVTPADGSATLWVDKRPRCTGTRTEVRRWLEAGGRRFRDFAMLRAWVYRQLAPAYSCGAPDGQTRPTGGWSHRAEDLTDLATVRQGLGSPRSSLYLGEEDLFERLRAEVRRQDEALRCLAGAACRHLARVAPRRPITVLAVGPTGCGKTRTGEVLPRAIRELDPEGAGCGYLRLDMADYQERHRVSQLLGAPQGYVGYGEGSQLLDTLAANPRTIVVFDEIEKAHRHVWRALMNAMDAGRLSSPAPTAGSREVDCAQAIFLFTSNLDAGGLLQELGERDAFAEQAVADEISRRRMQAAGVAPELVGRIHCFLVFRPLSPETRAEIMASAVSRVAEEYGLRVERVAPSVILALLAEARADRWGARPDEYLVDRILGGAFARRAASGDRLPVEVTGPPFGCLPASPQRALGGHSAWAQTKPA
jgi:hypothetical protein